MGRLTVARRAMSMPATRLLAAVSLAALAVAALVCCSLALAHPLDQGGSFTPIEHIVFCRDRIYIADVTAGVVRVVGRDGTLAGRLGEGVLRKPQGIAVGPDDTIFVADSGLDQVLVFDSQGRLVKTIGSRGRGPGQFMTPRAVDVAPDGRIAVADTKNHRIQVLAPDGRPLLVVGRMGNRPGEFNIPEGLRFGPDGLLYVADTVNHRVQVLDADGRVVRIIGRYGIDPGCLYFPEDVAIDSDGRVYVSDTFNQRISIFKPSGELLSLAYTFASGRPLTYPYGIALGEDEKLWVLDMPAGEVGVVPWQPAPPEVLAAAREAVAAKSRRSRRKLVDLLSAGQLSGRMLAVALAVALVLGAAHALEPGHGKTLVAAYLVGTHGRPWHAVLLGLTVTAAHVGSVLVVGLIALLASEYVLPSRIAPWLTLGSGLTIAGVGVWMFRRAGKPHSHSHSHPHVHGPFGHVHVPVGGHDHGDDHHHDHGTLGGHAHEATTNAQAEAAVDDRGAGAGGHHEHGHGHDHDHDKGDHDHHAPERPHDHMHEGAMDRHAAVAHEDRGATNEQTHTHHDHDLHGLAAAAGSRDHAADDHGCDRHRPDDHDHDNHHHHHQNGHHRHAHDAFSGHGRQSAPHGHGAAARQKPGQGAGHDHSHVHGPSDKAQQRPVGLAALLGLGISGGIVPCPSAIVVLLTAVSIGRIALGIALILAFSVGLALTLVAIGLAVTLGAGLIADRVEGSRLVSALPHISAGVVTGLGLLVAFQGLKALGYL